MSSRLTTWNRLFLQLLIVVTVGVATAAAARSYGKAMYASRVQALDREWADRSPDRPPPSQVSEAVRWLMPPDDARWAPYDAAERRRDNWLGFAKLLYSATICIAVALVIPRAAPLLRGASQLRPTRIAPSNGPDLLRAAFAVGTILAGAAVGIMATVDLDISRLVGAGLGGVVGWALGWATLRRTVGAPLFQKRPDDNVRNG